MQKKNIDFKNFNLSKKKLNSSKVIKIFKDLKKNLLDKKDLLLFSMSNKYENSFKTNELEKYRKFKFYKIIAMGGSILGSNILLTSLVTDCILVNWPLGFKLAK